MKLNELHWAIYTQLSKCDTESLFTLCLIILNALDVLEVTYWKLKYALSK